MNTCKTTANCEMRNIQSRDQKTKETGLWLDSTV